MHFKLTLNTVRTPDYLFVKLHRGKCRHHAVKRQRYRLLLQRYFEVFSAVYTVLLACNDKVEKLHLFLLIIFFICCSNISSNVLEQSRKGTMSDFVLFIFLFFKVPLVLQNMFEDVSILLLNLTLDFIFVYSQFK